MKTQLERLMERCKASVHVDLNPHLAYYETAGQYLGPNSAGGPDLAEETDPKVVFEMVRRNVVVRVQFYPETPIGSYLVLHYDLEAALTECHRIMDEERAKRRG